MKILAWILVVGSVPLGSLCAQNQNASQPSADDNEPVMFTLTIDDEMIAALRGGQSLMSTIPASIRGKVDRIRIEYKPSATLAPATQTPQNGNSILNRPTRSDGTTGQPTGFETNQPSSRPPNTGLNRSSGNNQPNFAAPALTDSVWNRSSAATGRSPSTLTPIDSSTSGWFFQTRRDSNTTLGQGAPPGGIQASNSSAMGFPLTRTTFDELPPANDIYTGPPAYSRSLPALDPTLSSSGISGSSPMAHSNAADNSPSVGANQILSKPPSSESGGREPLAEDSAAARRNDRTQVYMFMLLLCSLGLNVYLGWISRGFYVRYQELAGELRDTFTPSSV